jgi:hypothetical protein|tara:strand:+ start:1287 stop:1973 length:687 start_codon:yes stop_codon:yes gene_type:complete
MEKFNRWELQKNKLYYYLFVERFSKKINFDFPAHISRWDLIKKIIDIKNFKSYLEIGCDDDNSFSKINVEKKVGVDPHSGGNFIGTSDEFFLQNEENFDCIFIDGLHEYDQVCKDIHNSLKILDKNGIILLHDCLPPTLHAQAVPRYKKVWNGDVWKSIVKFRTNPNIDIVTCRIDNGISIIRKVKNREVLKIDCTNFKKLKFKDFFYNYCEYMRIIDFENLIKYIQH